MQALEAQDGSPAFPEAEADPFRLPPNVPATELSFSFWDWLLSTVLSWARISPLVFWPVFRLRSRPAWGFSWVWRQALPLMTPFSSFWFLAWLLVLVTQSAGS
jgi:hypothetical protein